MAFLYFKFQSKKLLYLLVLSIVFVVNEIIARKMKPLHGSRNGSHYSSEYTCKNEI